MLGWVILPEHSPTPNHRLGSTGSHLDLISTGRKWRKYIREAVSETGIFQRLLCLRVFNEESCHAGRAGCVSGDTSAACPPLSASQWVVPIALSGWAAAAAGTCMPQTSHALTGLALIYLFFNKCISARKVTVLAASPFTRECFLHLQAATCMQCTRGSVRSKKHWFFFPLHPARFQGETCPLCKGSMQLLCTGSAKKAVNRAQKHALCALLPKKSVVEQLEFQSFLR